MCANRDVHSGRELFYAIWQKVLDCFYDRERLATLGWSELKHRYDDRIVDDASAIICAEELLALLKERYTCILPPQEVAEKEERRTGETLYARNLVLPGNIGYIGIESFSHVEIAEQVRERLEGVAHCDGLIVNLCGNSGGLVNATANTLEFFIDEGEIAFTESRRCDVVQERFIYFTHEHFVVYVEETGQEPDKSLYMRHAAMVGDKPMVVLFDEDTASSAELFVAALLASGKGGRITSMGMKTSGKGIGQNDYDILGKVTLKVSCLRFFAPDQTWFGDAAQTVHNGIEPDIVFPHTDIHASVEAARLHLLQKMAVAA